jgi:uncharacterized protein YpmS
MNTKKINVLILITGLVMVSFSCNLLSTITPTQVRVVPTMPAADTKQLESQLATQVNEAMSGVPVTIELTETQISGLINSQSANQQEAQLSGLQVLLENNQMVITGDANASGVSGKLNVTLDVSTDSAGKPQLAITKATIGNFPIPAALLDKLSQAINQGMQGQGGEGFEILSLSIADHKLTIIGQKKQ